MFDVRPLALIFCFAAGPGAADTFDEARRAYLDGHYDMALSVLEPLARAGDAAARNILADAYDAGHGVERDHQRALELYRSAAAQGLASASYGLGLLLAQGRPGIPTDYAQAIVHLEEAMAQDYPPAFTSRGVMHALGQGGPVDPAAAVALYQRAHSLGDLNGTDKLADMLRRGEGVEQDNEAALMLWQGAGARGHGPSINNLGAMYENGIAVAQDPIAAEALYLLAAQAGSVQAGINLSQTSAARGDGVGSLAWCFWAEKRGGAPCLDPDPTILEQARALAERLIP